MRFISIIKSNYHVPFFLKRRNFNQFLPGTIFLDREKSSQGQIDFIAEFLYIPYVQWIESFIVYCPLSMKICGELAEWSKAAVC